MFPSRALEVVNSDLVIEVSADEEKLGELRLSRGTVDWVPRGHRRPFSMSWEQFDRLMQEHASR